MKEIQPTRIEGTITPPPSKSMTHRALILASFSLPGTRIYNLLESEDTDATKEGLERMGVNFKKIRNGLEIASTIDHGTQIINCRNSGTTLRLLTGVASLFPDETTLIGDESLMKRPMQPLVDALQQLGGKVSSLDGYPPIIVSSPIRDYARECEIQGNISSQFISSLLIVCSVRTEGLKTIINLIPPTISKPYLRLTQKMINDIGGDIQFTENQFNIVSQGYFPSFDMQIENDYSSAAFFIVAGALPRNNITITGLSNHYKQADAKIIDFVIQAGAHVEVNKNFIKIQGNFLNSFEANIEDCPDLFPILCVLASAANGTSTIYGAPHLQHKETNRINAMHQNFEKAGIEFIAKEDGAIITGGKPQGNIELNSFGDHRIGMACAILGTLAQDKVKIKNPECVNVSYPNFFIELDRVKKD